MTTQNRNIYKQYNLYKINKMDKLTEEQKKIKAWGEARNAEARRKLNKLDNQNE